MSARNFAGIEDLTLPIWNELFSLCRDIINTPQDYADICRGKVMASLFFEPSTRTSFSFQSAMLRLGGGVFGFSDPSQTSVSKGETFADTIKITSSYSDIIVLRSPYEGAAHAASLYSDVPVINAGDGGHMHPTQTLADLTTIAMELGKIADFNIGLCGDLKYGRTTHSLIHALSMFEGIKFVLISPNELALPEYMTSFMQRTGVNYTQVTSLEDALPELDVLYMTRVQRERFSDPSEYDRLRDVYILTGEKVKRMRRGALILHPLPRTCEITQEVDCDKRALYFKQARYGMFIRMALLCTLSRLERRPAEPITYADGPKCENPLCITNFEPYLPKIFNAQSACKCPYCEKLFTL